MSRIINLFILFLVILGNTRRTQPCNAMQDTRVSAVKERMLSQTEHVNRFLQDTGDGGGGTGDGDGSSTLPCRTRIGNLYRDNLALGDAASSLRGSINFNFCFTDTATMTSRCSFNPTTISAWGPLTDQVEAFQQACLLKIFRWVVLDGSGDDWACRRDLATSNLLCCKYAACHKAGLGELSLLPSSDSSISCRTESTGTTREPVQSPLGFAEQVSGGSGFPVILAV
jgi:hypothetical protein